MSARNATIEDLKKSYSTYCFESYKDEQTKTTTICRGCGERISLYDGHVCRKYSEKYSDRTEDYALVGAWKFKPGGARYLCSKCNEYEGICECYRYKEEMSGRVIEAMEKDKFIDGKTTLNSTLIDFNIMHGVAGIDWGKEYSKSVGTISQYGMFPMRYWEHHPVYLQLKENSAISCYIDNKGKIKGAVSAAGKQWYFDFVRSFYENKNIANVINISHSENAYHPSVLHFEIQLIEYTTETKPIPKMIYETGSDKPFYEQCAVCNQCDEWDLHKPKTENYTCQKCWPR